MFESLHRRPRGRRAARVLSAATAGLVQGSCTPDELRTIEEALTRREERLDQQAGALAGRDAALSARELLVAERAAQLPPWDPAVHDLPAYPRELGSISRSLLDRLDLADVSELERHLEGPSLDYWAPEDWTSRGYLTLTLGVHYGVEAIIEKTGLSPVMPPEDVHAMARGPLAAGGDPYIADFVMDALVRGGRPLEADGRALDFGCSSGRVLRVLAVARPDVEWLGCDPNEGAVAWADEHLDGIRFFASPQVPPLDLPDASLDVVYAISIWSHFDADAGMRWFEEMRRVLRPGGRLVFTTHGIASIGQQTRAGAMVPEVAMRCSEALYRAGFWFTEVFGEGGDHGVVSTDWGMAYMTPEWLLPRVQSGWTTLLYEPARLDANQDLYVLERR